MTLLQGAIQVTVALAPLFFLLIVLALIMSWIRVLVDSMSGRGL